MNNRVYCRGEVYYADMGKIDKDEKTSEQKGMRPVMIIQNDVGNKFSPTVIVVTISSQMWKKRLPVHVELDIKHIGLEKESFVMLEQFRTLDKSKLKSYIGRVSDKDIVKINKASNVSIGTEETKSRFEEAIDEKVEMIESTDVIYNRVSNRCNDSKVLMEILKEREEQIKELDRLCSSKGMDYKRFYNPMRGVELKRMVG